MGRAVLALAVLQADPQPMMTSPVPTELARDFWTAAYAAIDA